VNNINVTPQILTHPLALHLLTKLRDVNTIPSEFRSYCRTITNLLVLEATKKLHTELIKIDTPLVQTDGIKIKTQIAAVPILRAGLGMLESVLALLPEVSVGYIGLERNDTTGKAKSYYCKLPRLANHFTLLLDPMLATGGSACQAIDLLKVHGGTSIALVCVVAAPEGLANLHTKHPEVQIFTAAIDESLDSMNYIVPGVGDFGDRLYGTL